MFFNLSPHDFLQDSPYDAVSPHRNRHAQKAPVKAFDPNIDPMTGKKKVNGASSPLSKVDSSNQQHQTRPSFSSRATTGSTPNLPILNSDGTTSNNGLNQNHLNESHISFNGGSGSRNPSSSHVGGRGETDSMTSNSVPPSEVGDDDVGYYKTPSNQAEIWGVSSEPWQDFASPKQSSKDKNGKRSSKLGGGGGGGKSSYLMPGKNGSYDGNNNPNNRSGISSSASSVMDMEAILTGKTSEQRKLEAEEMKRRADNDGENLVGSGVSPFPERDWSTFKDENDGNGGGVRRNKSLIKRIKSARQSPNVPPPDDVDDVELSSLSNNNNNNDRRYGRNGRQHKYSPSTPPTSTSIGGGVDSQDPSSSNNYAFQGYGNNDGNNNNRMERKRGLGGSMRIRTRGLSPASGSGNHSSSPGGNGAGEGSTPTGSTAPSQDYLTVKGEDERRGRSNSNNSSPGATNGQGLGRSGSLFGRFGRKGKGSQKAQ